MKRTTPHIKEKKDVNVNTLFPSSLLDKLDEWAWRNRMTRSAALRALVEMAFTNEKRLTQPEEIAAPASEAQSSDIGSDIRAMLQENSRMQQQMQQTLQKVEQMQEQQSVVNQHLDTHNEAIGDIKRSLQMLEARFEGQS